MLAPSDPACKLRCSPKTGSIVVKIVLVAGVLGGLVLIAPKLAPEFAAWEAWIVSRGMEGWWIFLAASVVLMTVFVPSPILGALAGALFGFGWGVLAMALAGLSTASLTWLIARSLLRDPIEALMRRYPRLEAIQRAIRNDGARRQFLFRLASISPMTVNYLLGAAGVGFLPFMVASLGMLPSFFVEVYFGHLARHVSTVAAGSGSESMMRISIKVGGFVVCVVALIAVRKMARRAVHIAEVKASPTDSSGNRASP